MKKDSSKGKSKLPQIPASIKNEVKVAEKNLSNFIKSNKLDPSKDYSKDPKFGKKINELKSILKLARKKVIDSAPEEIHHHKKDDKPKPKKNIQAKYEYPLVNGKEMTSSEKKKYRVKMRAAASKDKKPIGKVSDKDKKLATPKNKEVVKPKKIKKVKREDD